MSTALITFDRPSGDRIADAVRTVEQMRPAAKPLTYLPILLEDGGGSADVFRVGTFSGKWEKGEKIVVTTGFGNPPRTFYSHNELFDIPASDTPSTCVNAKYRGSWFMVNVSLSTTEFVHYVSIQENNTEFGTYPSVLSFTRFYGFQLGGAPSLSIPVSTCATATSN